ncbi:hypothetical protein AUN02_02930 [Cronobacter sakazakii]|nr:MULTISPECIES: hypothetical protein [Cronobacter]MEB8638889.1 hypothetical protein [Cronobacter muytjensii]PUW12502.1 hypothetical protein AUM95_08685 [Cronobacter sakazakii]PUW32952.1 hypothetical protein AUN03_10615 [Cronobacter sakazakii]PUW34298.1 hypothetical protein AUN02_02930 [Cronobacter sakazakii]PUW36749.1 hypothetical protein AUN04_10430 [Cronobacter sakazakii]
MENKLLDLFANLLEEREATDVTAKDNVEDNIVSRHGRFKIKGKSLSYIIFAGPSASFVTVEYATEIDINKKKEIDIYKAVNKTNETCPALKCVIDKIVDKKVYLTFSVEVSARKFNDLNAISDMLDILPGGGVFFLDSLKTLKR